MAKGNDGNLLQHWVEADLAWRLYRQASGQPLHVVFTHGMAPYECFARRKQPGKQEATSGRNYIDGWLSAATRVHLPKDPPPVVFAYRDLNASASRYPNSGEIISALLGRGNVRGYISEVVPSKLDSLQYAWEGRGVHILEGSWRKHLDRFTCPTGGQGPWLFCMDPMSFDKDGEHSDEPPNGPMISPPDLERLLPVFRSYLDNGRPGVVALFCFKLVTERAVASGLNQKASYEPFKRAVEELACKLNCKQTLVEVSGGNPHVGGLLSPDEQLIRSVKELWDARHKEVGPRGSKKGAKK
jgi:hypothetical protein